MSENLNSNQENKVSWLRKITFEDIVVTFAFLVTLSVGLTISFFHSIPPIIVAIFFGIAIASLVYRFLGGINELTSFTITKGAKLTGSVAAIAIFMWFIDMQLTKQRNWIPPENLVLSFYKGSHPINKNIKVRPVSKPEAEAISVKHDGNVELPLKDIKDSEGVIIIIYEWPDVTGKGTDDICVTYNPNPPKIRLNFDFIEEITKKGFSLKNINLTFRQGITVQKDSGFIILDDKGEPIPEKNGEFFVPFNIKSGSITMALKEQLRPSVKILDLEYKVDPPEIKILIDKMFKDYIELTENQRKKIKDIKYKEVTLVDEQKN